MRPSNGFPCDWEFLPMPQPPQVFIARGLRLYLPVLEPWVARFVSLPSSLSWLIRKRMWHYPVHQQPPCLVFSLPRPISTPPTSLDECLFFNSSVLGLLYISVFGQFWLVFIFKLVVNLLLVVQGSKAYLTTPPSWPAPFEYLSSNTTISILILFNDTLTASNK